MLKLRVKLEIEELEAEVDSSLEVHYSDSIVS